MSNFETVCEGLEDCAEEQDENDYSGGFEDEDEESEGMGFSMGM